MNWGIRMLCATKKQTRNHGPCNRFETRVSEIWDEKIAKTLQTKLLLQKKLTPARFSPLFLLHNFRTMCLLGSTLNAKNP